MDSFMMMAVCLLSGMGLQAARILPADAHRSINVWLLYIALPAVSLKYIPKVEWSVSMLFPVVSTLIVWVGSWLYALLRTSETLRATL